MFLPKPVTPNLMFSVGEGAREEKEHRLIPFCTSSSIKELFYYHMPSTDWEAWEYV